jgi:hypothetical protein
MCRNLLGFSYIQLSYYFIYFYLQIRIKYFILKSEPIMITFIYLYKLLTSNVERIDTRHIAHFQDRRRVTDQHLVFHNKEMYNVTECIGIT